MTKRTAKRKTTLKKKAAKKSPARRRARAAGPAKAAVPQVRRTPVWEIEPEQQIVGATLLGKVTGYLAQAGVMTLVLEAPLAIGETIRVKGHATDLTQKVEHLELNRLSVQSATPGEGVGVSVADRVRVGDAVYKL